MFKKKKRIIKKNLRKININLTRIINQLSINIKKIVQSKLVGRYKSVFKGKGLEFEDFRDYTPEDDYYRIDWKASQKANKLLVRDYVEERRIKVYFIVDTSESMLFGSTEKLKHEYAADVAALLGYIALNSGDAFGFAFFNEKIIKFVKPVTGKRQFFIFLKELSDSKNYGGKFDIEGSLQHLFNLIEERSLVVILSDFLGVKRNFEKVIRLYGKKFDTIAIMIKDPRDEKLENVGEIVLQDPYSNRTLLIDTKVLNKKYEAYAKREEESIKDIFSKNDIDFVKLVTNKPFLSSLIALFKRRGSRKNESVAF